MVQHTKKFLESLLARGKCEKNLFQVLVTWCGMIATKIENDGDCGAPLVHLVSGKYRWQAAVFVEKFFEWFSRAIGIPAPVKIDGEQFVSREKFPGNRIVIVSEDGCRWFDPRADGCREEISLTAKEDDTCSSSPDEALAAATEKEISAFVKIAKKVYAARVREKELSAKCCVSRAAVDAIFGGDSYENDVFFWWLVGFVGDKNKKKNKVWLVFNETETAGGGFAETFRNSVVADVCSAWGVPVKGIDFNISDGKPVCREQCGALLVETEKDEGAAVVCSVCGRYKSACDVMSGLWLQSGHKIQTALLKTSNIAEAAFEQVIQSCGCSGLFFRRVFSESKNFKRYAIAHYRKNRLLNSL